MGISLMGYGDRTRFTGVLVPALARGRLTICGQNEGTTPGYAPGGNSITSCRGTAKLRTLFKCLRVGGRFSEVGRLFRVVVRAHFKR